MRFAAATPATTAGMAVRLASFLAVLVLATVARVFPADGAAFDQDGGSTFSDKSTKNVGHDHHDQPRQRLRRSKSADAPTPTPVDTFLFVYDDGTSVFASETGSKASVRIQFTVNASSYDVTLFRQPSLFEPGAKMSFADGTGEVAAAAMEPPHYKSADNSAGACEKDSALLSLSC